MVAAAGVAVLFCRTWGYWWGWSARSRCEDAPYVTNSGGQLGEKQVSSGGGELEVDAGPGHVTPTSTRGSNVLFYQKGMNRSEQRI